jgi:molybdate transport system ATP-binding protein
MISLRLQKQLPGFALDLSLETPEHEIVVLFGASGAGKSLTLAALAGFLAPDAGRIAIGEIVLFDAARGINLAPQARQVGMVRQDLALFPHLSAADNIAYGLGQMPGPARKHRIQELLELTHLAGLGDRRPDELSGGQQQRVALARALAREPALLLLDEPFSALDLATRIELRREVKELQRRLGTSMFFVTHDLGEAALLADRMAVISGGRILQLETANQILRAPANAQVARIVGVNNILPARVIAPRRVGVGEVVLEAETAPFSPGTEVVVCLRAERVMLVRPDSPAVLRANTLVGDLIHEESDGNTVRLRFRAQDARLTPDQEFDLWIDTPVYVYERLDLASQRHWHVALKPNAIHLVAE